MNESSQRNEQDSEPEHLERAADRLRADLDRTLGALERRLAPSQLLDRSLTYLREHGGELTHRVGDVARRNPVPIMLAVAGIGWLVVSATRNRNEDDDVIEGSTMGRTPMDESFGDESPYAQPQAAQSRLRRTMATARDRTRRAQYRAISVVEERPLVFGGIAVALGALIGAIIPATQYEDRVVGRARDRTVDRAKEVGERQYQNLRNRLHTQQDVEVSGRAH